MLVSLNWFKEFAVFPDERTLIHDLNRIGFEIEAVHHKGRDLSKIVVGHIKEFKAHPDADRLRVAQVDIGSDTIQIVTAADNVNEGDKIPVSLHGATLAGGLKIKKGKLRGVESNGMMCSAVECGLTDTSPGVWVLPTDTPVGVDFIEAAGLLDTVLDISILPNRGDALSLLGLARECHALYGQSKSFSPKEVPRPKKVTSRVKLIQRFVRTIEHKKYLVFITNQPHCSFKRNYITQDFDHYRGWWMSPIL